MAARKRARPAPEVIDLAGAQQLLQTRRFEPRNIRTSVLAALMDGVRARLPKLGVDRANRTMTRLGVLEGAHGEDDQPADFRASSFRLLLAAIDDRRLACRADAAESLRRLEPERAGDELLARWNRCALASPMDRWVEWTRLGMPGETPEALLDAVVAEGAVMHEPALLARTVDRIPDRLCLPLLVRHDRREAFARPLAARIVGATDDRIALIALLNDQRLSSSHTPAARRLVAESIAGAQAVLASAELGAVPDELFVAALEALPASSVEPRVLASPAKLYPALLASAKLLRANDWLRTTDELPEHGRELLVAVARDREHPARGRAVAALARSAAAADSRLDKRQYLFALGATGHPDATLPLLAALDDPDLADTGPLVCTALGSCGDTRALPALEARTRGRHAGFVKAAIEQIRGRTAEIHREVLLAAATDGNAVIRDLAQRAAAGDDDAAIVLEDALREMGRL